MPAAGFIEMALEFGAKTLSNVEFLTALPLPSDVPATVEVALDGAEWTVKTSSSLINSTEKTWIHRVGSMRKNASFYIMVILIPHRNPPSLIAFTHVVFCPWKLMKAIHHN